MPTRPYTLLTGSTGLIGGHLVKELLGRQIPIVLLVRDSLAGEAASKVEKMISKLEQASQRGFLRPKVISGDFSKPGLNITDEDRAWIGRHCGRVLHNAAQLSFKPASEHPHGEPYRTNVDGLVELVELCRGCEITEFHHVSSAYVCGNRSGRIFESELNNGQSFSNDYEHSKLLGEELLRTYFENLTVYRPSIVIDPTLKLVNLGDRTIYHTYSVYEYMAKMFGRPRVGDLVAAIGMTGDEQKNLVTAAWVAATIAEILDNDALHRRTYHLTQTRGTTIREIDAAFCQVLEERNIGQKRSDLSATIVLKQSALSDQFIKTFEPYFRDDPKFDQTNVLDVFNGDVSCLAPNVDAATVRKLVMPDSEGSASDSRHSVVDVMNSDPWVNAIGISSVEPMTGYRLGILLHGPGGGDWLVGRTKEGRVVVANGGAESADDVISSSSGNWSRWLSDESSISELAHTGQAILEQRQTTYKDGQRERLLSDLRRACSQQQEILVSARNRS